MVIDDFMGGEGDGGGEVLTVIDDFMGGEGDGGAGS